LSETSHHNSLGHSFSLQVSFRIYSPLSIHHHLPTSTTAAIMSGSIFLDYCLTCNSQIEAAREVYCSQQCRLADLCSPGTSQGATVPPTPYGQSSNGHSHSISTTSTASSSSQRHSSQFVLPPAFDFSSHRNSTVSMSSSSQSSSSPVYTSQVNASSARPMSGYFAYAGATNMVLSSSEAAKKTLSPTSSRSSIASTGEDVRAELRLYENGFDHVRDWRRRRASVYENTWRN